MSDQLPTRKQATGVIAYVEGWLWGAGSNHPEFEVAAQYLVEHVEEIADAMVIDECVLPDPA